MPPFSIRLGEAECAYAIRRVSLVAATAAAECYIVVDDFVVVCCVFVCVWRAAAAADDNNATVCCVRMYFFFCLVARTMRFSAQIVSESSTLNTAPYAIIITLVPASKHILINSATTSIFTFEIAVL